jgi:ABC-type bacteriocin/lantibiotic exporter with double-glycine peptidase domain
LRFSFTILLCLSTLGCVGYTGAARNLAPNAWKHERGWIAVDDVPVFRQHAEFDCGPTALAMVLGYWRKALPPDQRSAFPANQRASAGELRDYARARGMSAFVVAGTLADIAHELKQKRPVIVGVAKPSTNGAVAHYEVVVGLHPETQRIATLDPAVGWRQNSLMGFMKEWMPTGCVLLVVLPSSLAHSGLNQDRFISMRARGAYAY